MEIRGKKWTNEKTLEPLRACFLVAQAPVNCITFGLMSIQRILPGGPIGGGRKKVFGGLERIHRLAVCCGGRKHRQEQCQDYFVS